MLATLVTGAIVLLCLWDYIRKFHRQTTFAKYNIKGPIAIPILGCALEGFKVSSEKFVQYMQNSFEKYGKTFRLWVFNESTVFTINIKHFEAVLTSSQLLKKGDLYELLEPWLYDGLLLSTGEKWHSRRKASTPAYHFKALEQYIDVFDRETEILVQQLEPLADGKTVVDTFPYLTLTALDIITETAMGGKVNAQLNPNFPYVKALKRISHLQPDRMAKIDQRHDWMFRLTAPRLYRQVKKDIKTMRDFTIKVIEKRRDALEQSIANGSDQQLKSGEDDIGTRQKMDFLETLLRLSIDGKPLTNHDICEEVAGIMFAGTDTCSSGSAHALYCLARHPDVQQKVFEEIKEVIGSDKDAPITMKQLQQLKYMECVIKETLRLYPTVPVIGRKTTEDVKIADIVLPANSSIYLNIYFAHRDPDNYPEPESFKPERFSENQYTADAKGKRDVYSFIPFSAGPKNCLGQKFAMFELKAMISKMMRYYELLPFDPKVHSTLNFVLKSSRGINIGLRPRVYN